MAQPKPQRALEKGHDVLRRSRSIREGLFTAMRLRNHGDYHLRQALLAVYILNKAVYELAYELNHRPPWVGIPLHDILYIIEAGET